MMVMVEQITLIIGLPRNNASHVFSQCPRTKAFRSISRNNYICILLC